MDSTLLKYCKYYNGEDECPFKDGINRYFWQEESLFCSLSSTSRFTNEEYIAFMSECAPEIRHITEDKNIPIQTRAIVAFAVDDISSHSPMTDTSYFKEYGK